MAVNNPEKFRQIYNLENQIYVESDYDNIIIIDPNKVLDGNNKPVDRFVQQENLVMYANLETKIIPRTKLAIGESFDSPVNNTTIASLGPNDNDLNLNFLKPKGKDSFDTSWSDDFTGRGSRQGKSINQNGTYSTGPNGNKVFKSRVLNFEDSQTLGITRISVKISSIGVPTVEMSLTDIRGRALFEQGENSLYSVFFNLPYPTFYLVLKGYYGKAVRYKLTLLKFNAKFNSDSGNFEITLNLIGRSSAILADSIVSFAKHSPKMFRTQITTTKKTSNSNSTGVNTTSQNVNSTTIGKQKLSEVYSIYKSKGLIDKDFPEIDMETFIYRANKYDENVISKINNGDFDVINDITDYQNTLNELKQRIYFNSIDDFLDVSERIFSKGKIYYQYLESLKYQTRIDKKKFIEGEFDILIKRLESNTSFGKNGKYKLPGKTKEESGEISNKLKFDDLTTTNLDFNSISTSDFEKTYEINYGFSPTTDQLNKFITDFKTTNKNKSTIYDSNGKPIQQNPELWFFGDKVDSITDNSADSFLDKINNMNNLLESKRQEIEKELSEELKNILVNNPNGGLGFEPTMRNVFAVLFAGLDAFYRMMEDVHTNAWKQRKNPIRLRTILPSGNNVGTDAIDIVNGSAELNKENTVYPWPQYYELERNKDGTEQYTIKYPGDSTSIQKTKAYNSTTWPEISFTEEFIAASLEKNTPVTPQVTGNQNTNTDYVSISAIEFPFNDLPYGVISDVSFLYEIFERSYLGSNYNKLNRGKYKNDQIDKFLSDIEGENIKNSLKLNINPFLTDTLKNIKANFVDYLNNLKTISSNGAGTSWVNYSNSTFNTQQIKNYIEGGYNKVYSNDTLNGISIAVAGNVPFKDKITDFINNKKSSEEYFLDPYPFNDVNWLKENLQDGDKITSVSDFYETKSLIYLDDKKTIARLYENENIQNINLFANKFGFENYSEANYLVNQENQVIVSSRDSLSTYYENKKLEYLYLTESFVDYGNEYSGNVKNFQTTSFLNTPYFINALQLGVEKSKNINEKTPYAALGYLFLNSLPLITTKEKLKQTNNSNEKPNDLDYLAATFNKFSAIHKLPYAWVLKYGSIWHRYKKVVEEQVDILDSVWKDFDFKTNYDPINSATTTSYSGDWVGNIVLQETTSVTNTSTTADTITTGFFLKTINDVYRFFYNKDLDILQSPTYSNFVKISNDYGFKVVNSYNGFYDKGFDNSQTGRTITIKNYHEYFEKPNGDDTKILVIPSMGALTFNQGEFECFNNLNKKTEEMFNNNSVYNGSVRSLWSAPNFGYYNNNLIKKPAYNEYIRSKNIGSSVAFELNNNQESYSNIEEIFALFEPNILDEFERLFLTFCDPKPKADDLILEKEQTNATITTIGQVNNVNQKRLYNQIESLFLIPKNGVDLSGDDISDGKSIAKSQMNNFAASLKDFLTFDCVLKMGNPSNFERKSFNFFTDNAEFKPLNFINPTQYVKGTLPGDVLNTTLLQSQSQFPNEWATLRKYVGEFNQKDITYSNSGSAITDFFIKNNIEFSKNNIEVLYPLIRLYAKEKLSDNNLNGPKFNGKINSFMKEQRSFNSDILEGTLRYLNKNLDDTKIQTNSINSKITGNVTKLEYYTTLKTMNDKWISGTDFLTKTIFEDFLFLDRANRDIGDKVTIDISEMSMLLADPNKSYLQLISTILEKNRFLFFAMPAYFNFYGLQEAILKGTPIPVDIPNSLFGTYLDVDYIDSRPKFLCVYIGKPSEHPASEAKYVRYKDDAFDLRKYDNPIKRSYGPDTDFSKNNRVVGFAVDYGIQNQSIFKGIDLDMSEKKNTSESNRLITELANRGAGNEVAQQTVSLYSIYKARSYTTTVRSMGNAMIQPTMYFNLRHVPLFYGPYWIMSVNHDISPGKFETTFKGVRMPLYSLPEPNSLLESVNKNYTQYYKELILNRKKITEQPNIVNLNDINVKTNVGALQGSEKTCEEKVQNTQYNDKEFFDINITNISESEIIDLINVTEEITQILKPLYYGIIKTKYLNTQNGVVWSTPNHNLFNISALNKYNQDLVDLYVKGLVCATTSLQNQDVPYPYFTFESFSDCFRFYNEIVKTYSSVIEKLKEKSTKTTTKEKYAEAYTIFTLFWDQARYIKEGGGNGYYGELPKSENDFIMRYNEKVIPTNVSIYQAYETYEKIFQNSFDTFTS